ncbi:rCG63111 [Rattus norvegicus]|uniref:RCG63111 n=1 Tax=Rattus norvegicus TaxID=10116 RepID=A6K6I0_RAT|nr:rCG63111 [Rattus norvegicus]
MAVFASSFLSSFVTLNWSHQALVRHSPAELYPHPLGVLPFFLFSSSPSSSHSSPSSFLDMNLFLQLALIKHLLKHILYFIILS